MTQAALSNDQMQATLAGIWKKSLPLLKERVTVLEQAVAAHSNGTLADKLRHLAGEEAHKLAGLLGTFGYPEGTDAARMLETEFDAKPGFPGELIALRAQTSNADAATMRDAVVLLRKIVGS